MKQLFALLSSVPMSMFCNTNTIYIHDSIFHI